MKVINSAQITEEVKRLCIEGNLFLGRDVVDSFRENLQKEESDLGKDVLNILIENAEIACKREIPICQDTGMAVFFVKDNTPAVIHYDMVKGDNIEIVYAPKGFGSENMSQLKMLKPSDGLDGIKKFIVDVVSEAGPNPCPPIVVGVGIGGTVDKCAQIAKKALTREIGEHNKDPFIADLEKEMLEEVNNLGIGPQGLGGRTTALAVNIETFPTHIAGLPVVVNINCHASRHKSVIL